MTLHLVGFPHTRLDGGFETCAYTQKVGRFRRMDLGHDLVVYGGPGADVEVITEEQRLELFGPDDAARLPLWPNDGQWQKFNLAVVGELAQRSSPGDLVLFAGGYSQKVIAEITLGALGLTACEPGVGYEGIFTDACAFESNAWMHHVYGLKGIRDGRLADTVIPNYFDPDDFPHLNQGDGDYLLFLGRVTLRKGPHIAAAIAAQAGMRLKIAGPGVTDVRPGHLVADYVDVIGDHVDYLGAIDKSERAELLAGARAVIAPTVYLEPFGGVAVEAMMAGTPVIASDWGAFTETVENGVTGYRIRTPEQAAHALLAADELDSEKIRRHAIERYSLEAVTPRFRQWFDSLASLSGDSWHIEAATAA